MVGFLSWQFDMLYYFKLKLYYFSAMADLKLLAHLESYITENRLNRFNKVLSQRTKHFAVAVEDVYHLHNTSAVMRSCDVFGVQDLHVIEAVNRKRIDREIAMGAQKWVDLHRHSSSMDCVDVLRKQGYQIVATTPHTDNILLDDFNIETPACFFFGREVDGLSDQILQQADCHLKIPMVGFTESLNISVSVAIILQYVTTQLRQSQVAWQLSEHEKTEIKMRWIKNTIHSYDKIVEHYYNTK